MSDYPEIEAFARAQAPTILADLGYEPLREIPWSDPPPPQQQSFRDVELESDISRLRDNQADLVARLRGLAPETDSFSLPVSGDSTALAFNEVLVDAQRFLLQGTDRIATAAQRYRNIVNETPSTGSRLVPEDLAYAQHELTRRRELAEQFLAYSDNPVGTSVPRKPSGEVISPILAGGLAHKYAMDALELHHRLNRFEPTLALVNEIEDNFNLFAGTIGAVGSEYLKALAAKLEAVRKRGLRWRRVAVTMLSVFLLLAGVLVDKSLSQAFGDLLWLSIAAVSVMWIYDRIVSTIVEKQIRKQRLGIVMDAIDSVAGWLIFLRRQQALLNVLRTSTDRPIVQLADDWC